MVTMSQLPENPSPSRFHISAGSTTGFDLQPLPDGLEAPTSIEPAIIGILLYFWTNISWCWIIVGAFPLTAATVHLARIFASS
jgi:hypothetical protein